MYNIYTYIYIGKGTGYKNRYLTLINDSNQEIGNE